MVLLKTKKNSRRIIKRSNDLTVRRQPSLARRGHQTIPPRITRRHVAQTVRTLLNIAAKRNVILASEIE